MQNHYLKAVDAAALRAALVAASILVAADTDPESGPTLAPGYCLDEIGEIIKPTGDTIEVDGVDIPEMAPVPGWHANLLADLSDEQQSALAGVLLPVPPAQPYRVWA